MLRPMPAERVLYCLTRDRELAAALDARLDNAIAFFYNDAARLHQAILLRTPDVVVIDTGAIRPEYGDAGLGPVIAFVRERVAEPMIAVRPAPGAEWLVAAEAGPIATIVPAELEPCVDGVAAFCARAGASGQTGPIRPGGQ
jgi:hypothetical protein